MTRGGIPLGYEVFDGNRVDVLARSAERKNKERAMHERFAASIEEGLATNQNTSFASAASSSPTEPNPPYSIASASASPNESAPPHSSAKRSATFPSSSSSPSPSPLRQANLSEEEAM